MEPIASLMNHADIARAKIAADGAELVTREDTVTNPCLLCNMLRKDKSATCVLHLSPAIRRPDQKLLPVMRGPKGLLNIRPGILS